MGGDPLLTPLPSGPLTPPCAVLQVTEYLSSGALTFQFLTVLPPCQPNTTQTHHCNQHGHPSHTATWLSLYGTLSISFWRLLVHGNPGLQSVVEAGDGVSGYLGQFVTGAPAVQCFTPKLCFHA